MGGDGPWQVRITGNGFAQPASANFVRVGDSICSLVGSSTQLDCTLALPPGSGPQTITLSRDWGKALGAPLIDGAELDVSSISLSQVTMAGGAQLTISGSGFARAAASGVDVCGRACNVTSATGNELQCTLPSLLSHASGKHETILTNATDAALQLAPAPPAPPPPPFPPTALASPSTPLGVVTVNHDVVATLRQHVVSALHFEGLLEANLPRGSTLGTMTLRVVPHGGTNGAVVVDARASLFCGAGPAPLSSEGLASFNTSNATITWDVQPYGLGFAYDESPDLSSLVRDAIESSESLDGCSILITLSTASGIGTRHFYTSASPLNAPQLIITYTPPSSAAQLAWASPRSCVVNVSVPTESSSCADLVDGARMRPLADTQSCPHLLLEATAASTSTPCELRVNGVDMMQGCGLRRLEASNTGVCVALVNPPYAPRASCFDTRIQGDGAEKLASWIRAAPLGSQVMLASCSRLAWAHSRDNLTSVMATLGAANTPARIDDAYALIGIKSASATAAAANPARAEARTPCCTSSLDMQGNPTDVCHTCDQTLAVASAYSACGVAPTSAPATIGSLGYVGAWASAPFVSDVSLVSSAARYLPPTPPSPTSVTEVLSQLQREDGDALDTICSTTLTSTGLAAAPFGTQLATDGDASTYWMQVGSPDAVLTIDLGAERTIRSFSIDWRFPARSVLVLYSPTAAGNDWQNGTNVQMADTPPTTMVLEARARRIRLLLADAVHTTYDTNTSTPTLTPADGLPLFGVRELRVDSCALPRAYAHPPTEVMYSLSITPTVQSVTPNRGSSAGGTAVVLSVTSLPAAGQVTVSFAGVSCAVTSVERSAGRVHCTTGLHGRTSLANPGGGPAQLTIDGVGTAAAAASAIYTYVDLWSRNTTWGGGPAPLAGDSVWVPPGQTLYLDTSPPKLYMLVIQGHLVFDRVDIDLQLSYIFVMGGSLTIGTEREPFLQQAQITLWGNPVSQEIPLYGSKVLGCRACTLDLHGRPLLDGRTHTKLGQTARRGSRELWLTQPVDWDALSEVLVTSTAANGTMEEAETVVLLAVLDGGYRLQLGGPLLYDHLGETRFLAGGHSIEMRANVAILTRNVRIQGNSPMSQLDKHGAHVMMHSRGRHSIMSRGHGESLTGRIENIELRYVGQGFRLGRYPLHFHMIGSVRNSYVRKNSIHHTYNRAVAIHGVHYLRVQDNVAFETMGHTFFIEDGIETKNIITGNLGANTRPSFALLTVDATPATYWIVNPDNYVANNIAAGSTHYGIWFFPEPFIRGASLNEPGASAVCPQGIPLLFFADNEGHNNGRYGLRIFTGKQGGRGFDGYYPTAVSSCADVSATNPFVDARFERQYSWRNGKNGITVGSIAHVHLIDPVVADNNMRGIEMLGADGITTGLGSVTKMRGPWGKNLIVRPIFIGHSLSCPACGHSRSLINFPIKDGPLGWPTKVRLGLETPAWFGLWVRNATFINYDRDGMVAVAGFAKALPPHGAGYDFRNSGAMETRFSATTWLQSTYRVRWRWNDEALFVDTDGTFADQPFCAGCSVLHDSLVADRRAFPECYQDARYGGTVCRPSVRFVQAGFLPPDPFLLFGVLRASYLPGGIYVRPDDATYLFDKWRPDGSYFLVRMDVAAESPSPVMIGELATLGKGRPWTLSRGSWLGTHTLTFIVTYVDWMDLQTKSRQLIAEISPDGSQLTFVNGTDMRYGHTQLFTHVTWHRCSHAPERCVGPVRYDNLPSWSAPGMNLANTPHFEGSQFQFLLAPNRRYQIDGIISSGNMNLEQFKMEVGHGLRPDEYIEFETNPYGAYAATHVGVMARPWGSLPGRFAIAGAELASSDTRASRPEDETFAGRRKLSTGSVTYDEEKTTTTLRVSGSADCLTNKPYDPCAGVVGQFATTFLPPPSPPPPSPPLPPPPPPTPPPSPLPPHAPRAFALDVAVSVDARSLNGGITPSSMVSSVQRHTLAQLPPDERLSTTASSYVRIDGTVTMQPLEANPSDSTVQESVRSAVERRACPPGSVGCSVSVQSTTSGRRLDEEEEEEVQAATGSITLAIVGTKARLDEETNYMPARQASQTALNLLARYVTADLGLRSYRFGSIGVTAVAVVMQSVSLGTDTSDVAARTATIRDSVANDLDISSTSDVIVSTFEVYHPPNPPPVVPPSPSLPPAPPAVPPTSPSIPPASGWSVPYTTANPPYSYSDCDPSCVGGCISSLWSNVYTWHGQGTALGGPTDDALVWPGFKSNVTIKRCRTVVLDVDINVQLYSVVVYGTLVVQNRPDAQVSLRAMCIAVKCVTPGYCGQIVAGTPQLPFQGGLEFLLSGDEFSESHQCGGLKGKYFDVQRGAELLLHGQKPQQRWSRLRSTAGSGDSHLIVIGRVDWLVDDELLIATTGGNAGQTERKVVASTRPVPALDGTWDTQVMLTQPLSNRHVGVTEVHNGHELEMRAEVAVINRPLPANAPGRAPSTRRPVPYKTSIRIAGVDSNVWNWRFYTMRVSKHGVMMHVMGGARAVLSGVVIEDGGCHFPSIVCMRDHGFVGPMLKCSGSCTVTGSSLTPNLGHGISASSGTLVQGNVIFKPSTGVQVRRSARVVDNVVYSVEDKPKNLGFTDEDAGFALFGGSSTVLRNAVAGSNKACFSSTGFAHPRARFQNNSGHASMMGFINKGRVRQPIQDLTLYQITHIAIWGYAHGDVTISNVRIADFSIGMLWGSIGPDSATHIARLQTVTLRDSLLVGRTATNAICNSQVGILLGTFAGSGPSISPSTCGPLGGHWTRGIYGMEHPTGSNPALIGEARVTNVTFHRFLNTQQTGGCGGTSFVAMTNMRGGMESSDAIPPHFFKEITIDAESRTNLANLPPPKQAWIAPSKCIVMDCDGPRHVLLHDLDGSLTGLGVDASVIARAEHMNQYRADTSKFTWYNIPTKMLYDPAPYNDPGDPGWDMSAYMAYNNGAQTFTYRRRLAERERREMDRRRLLVANRSQTVPADGTSEYPPAASRRLSSAVEADWRNRMVFYTGDERSFYQGNAGPVCDPYSAIYDPSCRTIRKTHHEVAYRGYGTYRGWGVVGNDQCQSVANFNAWRCRRAALVPARLLVESMDSDHTSRSLTPVALASGGYVDLMNAGWSHQRARDCGGYECLRRLMTFHTTVAVNRSYDLAFTGTNPQSLRLMLPFGAGHPENLTSTRLLVSIFYSNPQQLQVHCNGRVVPPLEAGMRSYNSYNFSMRKPVITDECCSNAYAAWENKMYVLLCGGIPGLEIRTINRVVLSLGIAVTTEDFFDQHYLVRNLASLFGIPTNRMRVPRIVAGSRLVDVEIPMLDTCANVACGIHGACGSDGACVCDPGWRTAATCHGGDCVCSEQVCNSPCKTCLTTDPSSCTSCVDSQPLLLPTGGCGTSCPWNYAADTSGACLACNASCHTCNGPRADQCTSCASFGVNAHLHNGQCLLSCPPQTYEEPLTRVCKACHGSCRSCTGPRSTECTSCTPNSCTSSSCPPHVLPILDRSTCVSRCADGRYPNASGACQPCHSACRLCRGPGNHQCIDPTPRTPFRDSDCQRGASRRGRRCVLPGGCSDGSVGLPATSSRPGECVSCSNFDCRVCDPADSMSCLACKPGWIRPALIFEELPGVDAGRGRCHERCGDGFFTHTNATCLPCDASCDTCDGPDAGSCLTCPPASPIFRGGGCHADCPPAFVRNDTGNGTVVCAPCSVECATCTAAGDSEACTACIAGSSKPFLLGSNCTTFCPSGQYGSTVSGRCEACDPTCEQCDSIGCTVCKRGQHLLSGRCVVVATVAPPTEQDNVNELMTIADRIGALAPSGGLDTGFPLGSVAMARPNPPVVPVKDEKNDTLVHEIQRISLIGNTSGESELSGTIVLGFNDETTAPIDITRIITLMSDSNGTDSANEVALQVKTALELLGTISVVGVAPNFEKEGGKATLSLDVNFHDGDIVPTPLNLGPLPLMTVGFEGTGLANSSVHVVRPGQAPVNYSFAEKVISINVTTDELQAISGGVRLAFNNRTTPAMVPLNGSAVEVREALMELETIGEVEVFRGETETGHEYRVRFYQDGDPPHVGAQPPLDVDTRDLIFDALMSPEGRRLQSGTPTFSIGVYTAAEGSSPFTEEDRADSAIVIDEDYIEGNASTSTTIDYVPVVHVCGNSVRSSEEQCDDGSTVGGDGCNSLCLVERGWQCTSSSAVDGDGTGVGGLDTCTPLCGDGLRVLWSAVEQCDDNNTMPGDGCSPTCQIETGFTCIGGSLESQDVCTPTCGDGLRVGLETCDDGNRIAGDGCGFDCMVEDGFTCSGGSASGTDTCVACHESCATCSGPLASQCVSCGSSHPFLSATGACFAVCPVGTFADASTGVCAPCDPSCGPSGTCVGSAVTECTSCTLPALTFLDAGRCVAQCTASKFVDVVGGIARCTECDSSCAECSTALSNGCLSCPSTGTPYFDSGSCVASCADSHYADSSLMTCQPCDPSCATCTAVGATSCSSCLQGSIFDAGSGACTFPGCAIGQFASTDQVFGSDGCLSCNSTCASCVGSAANCTSCALDSTTPLLHEAECLMNCPDGYFADNADRCATCHGDCETCSGPLATDCATCSGSKPYTLGSTCLAQCPPGRTPDTDGICQLCDATCLTCDGLTASGCTSCPTFAPYLHQSACIGGCPLGMYPDAINVCQQCDSTCRECTGPSSSECSSCDHAGPLPHLDASSSSCTCRAGYRATAEACTQVDECAEGSHNCYAAELCTDTAGSFMCTCPAGMLGSGTLGSCSDVDECISNSTNYCNTDLGRCVNRVGAHLLLENSSTLFGYTCECTAAGYGGNGFFCADVDECRLGTHSCHPDSTCVNTVGGYQCECNPGYRSMPDDCEQCHGNHNCTDIDECYEAAFGNPSIGASCHQERATCTNSPGSYSCACNSGYGGNGNTCDAPPPSPPPSPPPPSPPPVPPPPSPPPEPPPSPPSPWSPPPLPASPGANYQAVVTLVMRASSPVDAGLIRSLLFAMFDGTSRVDVDITGLNITAELTMASSDASSSAMSRLTGPVEPASGQVDDGSGSGDVSASSAEGGSGFGSGSAEAAWGIGFSAVLAGSISDFDAAAQANFTARLAAMLNGTSPDDIRLSFAAASVAVSVSIATPTLQAALAAQATLGGLDAPTLSSALGVTAQSVGVSTLSSPPAAIWSSLGLTILSTSQALLLRAAPSPPPPSPPPSPPPPLPPYPPGAAPLPPPPPSSPPPLPATAPTPSMQAPPTQTPPTSQPSSIPSPPVRVTPSPAIPAAVTPPAEGPPIGIIAGAAAAVVVLALIGVLVWRRCNSWRKGPYDLDWTDESTTRIPPLGRSCAADPLAPTSVPAEEPDARPAEPSLWRSALSKIVVADKATILAEAVGAASAARLSLTKLLTVIRASRPPEEDEEPMWMKMMTGDVGRSLDSEWRGGEVEHEAAKPKSSRPRVAQPDDDPDEPLWMKMMKSTGGGAAEDDEPEPDLDEAPAPSIALDTAVFETAMFNSAWDQADGAQRKLQMIADLAGAESGGAEEPPDFPKEWVLLVRYTESQADRITMALDRLQEFTVALEGKPSWADAIKKTSAGSSFMSKLAVNDRRTLGSLALDAAEQIQIFLDLAMVVLDDASGGANGAARRRANQLEEIKRLERKASVPKLPLYSGEKLDKRDSAACGLSDSFMATEDVWSWAPSGAENRLEDFGPLDGGAAHRLAFTADDVGSTVQIRGRVVVIDGLARTVDWQLAKGSNPPQTKGKILEVEEVFNGTVTMRDGTTFANKYVSSKSKSDGPGRARERGGDSDRGSCNQTRAKLALKTKLKKMNGPAKVGDSSLNAPSKKQWGPASNLPRSAVLPAPVAPPAPSAAALAKIGARKSEGSSSRGAAGDVSERRLSAIATRSGELDLEDDGNNTSRAPKVRGGKMLQRASMKNLRSGPDGTKMRWRKAAFSTIAEGESAPSIPGVLTTRSLKQRLGLEKDDTASKKMAALKQKRGMASTEEADPSKSSTEAPRLKAIGAGTDRLTSTHTRDPKDSWREAVMSVATYTTDERASRLHEDGHVAEAQTVRMQHAAFVMQHGGKLTVAERKKARFLSKSQEKTPMANSPEARASLAQGTTALAEPPPETQQYL